MPARLSLSVVLVAALFAVDGASAQQSRPYALGSYLQPLANAEKDAAALPAEAYARPRTPEVETAIRRMSHALQSLATNRSYVGDTDGAIAAFDLQMPARPLLKPQQVANLPGVEDARAEDAIRAIVEQARSKQIVLINEAHHVPMHRAFTRRLAQELRKIGYTYLAAETFNADSQGRVPLSAAGRTQFRTGTYTWEPGFADFVNEAVADGWTLVPYEIERTTSSGLNQTEQVREREQVQARQLIERTLGRDKNAKVLIHVGYHHLIKVAPGDKMPFVPMGELIRRLSGVPTLHVDQTQFYAHPDPALEHPMYAGLLGKFPETAPFVLRAPDGSHPVLSGYEGRIDMQVIFPRYATRDGRPEWLQTLAGRAPRPIPSALLPKQGRRVIKAFRPADGKDAVPADVVLLDAGKPAPALMLPAGDFRFETEE
ncbi:hypothetical protein SRABI118_01847 [Massilia sp. Bi118]|uniref:hypothetical protein n=1 Tax=Massilia sp. Bi118 TaxID=2822346 RepID=UPI001D7D13C7|nr:hypothetical protein [Massilia sp. Bi118]CAH0205468.1 hypothetical protein SRABI118_01847 [Massilia sp. Bi118]